MTGKSEVCVQVALCQTIADFSLDSGRIILETDGTAIASRVSRPKADASDIVINEQTIMNACKFKRVSIKCIHSFYNSA